MGEIRIRLVDRSVGRSPVTFVRLPTIGDAYRTAARHRPAHIYTGVVATYVQEPSDARSSTADSSRRRWPRREDRAAPTMASAANRQSRSPAERWINGLTVPYPPPTTTMVAMPTPSDIAPTGPLIDDDTVQQPPTPTSTSSTTPITDTHPPTTRRVRFNDVLELLPQPSIVVPPPLWVCCPYGMQHNDLTIVYSWLIGHCGCDEASVMGFFALLQYNPDGYDACIEIIEEIKAIDDRDEVRNHSSLLARACERTRHIVYPDGGEHEGKQSADVHARTW